MDWSRASKTEPATSVETSARVLGLLRQDPTLSARRLADRVGLSLRAVEMQLARLKATHKLRRVGPNKGGRWEVLE